MITHLTGTLIEKTPPHIVLDVGGVGYLIHLPLNLFEHLPPLGEQCKVLTHFLVKEDSQQLFGFLEDETRRVFQNLLKINGIGARSALTILSHLTPQKLFSAVQNKDSAPLTKIPGIGKKTADRLILELGGKLSAVKINVDSPQNDVLNALLALGYSEKESLSAIQNLTPDLPLAEALKRALSQLSRF